MVKSEVVKEYGAKVTLYKHRKTGAEIMSVSVDDDNKVRAVSCFGWVVCLAWLCVGVGVGVCVSVLCVCVCVCLFCVCVCLFCACVCVLCVCLCFVCVFVC
jgi:hypothetical protein